MKLASVLLTSLSFDFTKNLMPYLFVSKYSSIASLTIRVAPSENSCGPFQATWTSLERATEASSHLSLLPCLFITLPTDSAVASRGAFTKQQSAKWTISCIPSKCLGVVHSSSHLEISLSFLFVVVVIFCWNLSFNLRYWLVSDSLSP